MTVIAIDAAETAMNDATEIVAIMTMWTTVEDGIDANAKVVGATKTTFKMKTTLSVKILRT